MSAPDRFEKAVFRLPHVSTDKKDQTRRFPRCWWQIEPGDAAVQPHENAHVLATYTLDCALGDALWTNLRDVLHDYPEHAGQLVESTLHDMAARGRLSGIEIAFLGHLSRYLFVRLPRSSALAVVKPIVIPLAPQSTA